MFGILSGDVSFTSHVFLRESIHILVLQGQAHSPSNADNRETLPVVGASAPGSFATRLPHKITNWTQAIKVTGAHSSCLMAFPTNGNGCYGL